MTEPTDQASAALHLMGIEVTEENLDRVRSAPAPRDTGAVSITLHPRLLDAFRSGRDTGANR